jgi:glutamyl-tRNA reductase
MEELRQKELKKTFGSLSAASEEDRAAIDRLTAALVNKILHGPTVFLKQSANKDEKSLYVDMTRKLFSLDEPGEPEPEPQG